MGVRTPTIYAALEKAIEQLEKGKNDAAKATITKIMARMDGDKAAKPRKANKFALHVKSQYPKYKKEYPDLDAPFILKKIAADYKSTAN